MGLRSKLKLAFRRSLKQWIGPLVLAPLYHICSLRPIKKNMVILADEHQNSMPFSMMCLAEQLRKMPELEVIEYFHDYSFCSPWRGLMIMLRFMPLFARASHVFICDCYIPVSCCKKRRGTKVIQLWHSCGLMKKVGNDSAEERKLMSRRQYRNYDIFTTSSPAVASALAPAMGLPPQIFNDSGVSRMDYYFQYHRIQRFRRGFFAKYPEYAGKKIVLWVPTFRGTAQTARLAGQDEILRLKSALPDDYALIIKTHRFIQNRDLNTPISYSSELLLAIADILITDYSSIYYDYLLFRRPIILFAPDLAEYRSRTGLYLDYESLPGKLAKTYGELKNAVLTAEEWADRRYLDRLNKLWEEQMSYCDGHSTDKLLHQLELLQE